MTQENKPLAVNRILVPLDSSEDSLAALEEAARMASILNAELEVLFVEDINMLHLAEMPFAREISFFQPSARQLEKRYLERQMRILAESLYKKTAQIATRNNITWKFRVTRGGVSAEVLAAAANADLTILGKIGGSLGGRTRIGSTVKTVISRGKGLAMIVQQKISLGTPVQIFYSGSQLSIKALHIAQTIVALKRSFMLIYILADTDNSYVQLQNQVNQIMMDFGTKAEFKALARLDLQMVYRTIRNQGSGPLVLPCEGPLFQGEELQSLINNLPNPVLLIRESGDAHENAQNL